MESVVAAVVRFRELNRRPCFVDTALADSLIKKHSVSLLRDEQSRSLINYILHSPTSVAVSGELHTDAPFKFIPQSTIDSHKIQINLKTQARSFFVAKPQNIEKFEVCCSVIPLVLSNGSEFSRALFPIIKNMSDEDLKDTYPALIQYKWDRIFYIALAYTLLHMATSVIAYIFLGYHTESLGLGITLCLLNTLFILYEVKGFSTDPKKYVRYTLNYVDLCIQGLCLGASIAILAKASATHGLAINWIRFFIVLFLGMRSITWLRVFKPTRHLIRILMEVAFDIIPFLIILVSFIMIFGFTWKISPALAYNPQAELEFYPSIQVPVYMIFGNWPDSEQSGEIFGLVKFFVMVGGNLVITLTLSNFLIALLSGTFERINEEAELYNLKETLDFIEEFDDFSAGIRLFGRNDASYCIALKPAKKNDEQAMSKLDSIIESIAHMQADISDLKQSMTQK